MNPFFHTDFSISDSLKTVRKSVLIYETIINRRSLRAEIVNSYLSNSYTSLDDAFTAIYTAKASEYVCPAGGTFSWESTGTDTGQIKCSDHDGTGAGGSGGGSGGGTSGGGGTPGETPGGGSGSSETYLDTGLPISFDTWPTEAQYDALPNTWSTLSIAASGIFRYGDDYYVIPATINNVTREHANAGPTGLPSTNYYIRLNKETPIIQESNFTSGDNHVYGHVRGDMLFYKGLYYVKLNTGGASPPNVNASEWYLIPGQ